MAKVEKHATKAKRFRPYAESPPDRERIQRLEDFFTWLYREYGSRDAFDYDFFGVLSALEMSTGTTWSSEQLTTYLGAQDFVWRQNLQRRVRGWVDNALAGFDTPSLLLLPPSLGAPYRGFVGTGTETEGRFLHRGYVLNDKEPPNDERLSDMLILRLVDVLLQGINLAAIVRCSECGHFTARSHPRGKLYCSPDCRVRASLRTRRETLQAAQAQKDRKSSRKKK
ncbi:MAG: hypothetical protein FJ147_08475 [Deltaproteobacteria bacterium]|nr:hypothetical protein [Deltaproteobacteria bacterium]